MRYGPVTAIIQEVSRWKDKHQAAVSHILKLTVQEKAAVNVIMPLRTSVSLPVLWWATHSVKTGSFKPNKQNIHNMKEQHDLIGINMRETNKMASNGSIKQKSVLDKLRRK